MDFSALTKNLSSALISNLQKKWEGKATILEMRDGGCSQWKQMEWPGWYFQWKCETILKEVGFTIPGPCFGNVEFDGFKTIPWDFKAHTMQSGTSVPTNGLSEIQEAIQEYGAVGFIVGCGEAEYDQNPFPFKAWVDSLKGEISDYEINRIKRNAPSRVRKTAFTLKKLAFVIVDKDYKTYKEFQGGMRNSDGTPRKRKMMLDLNDTTLKKWEYTF